MSDAITLYDIPGSATPDVAWSSNVWRTRYVLHIKGLAYKTIWVEYPDIAPTLKGLDADPTGTRDGAPLYTLPVIHDPTTGALVSDSLQIALYLDAQYPDTPQLLKAPTRALQIAFLHTFVLPRLREPPVPLVINSSANQLSPSSEEWFRRSRVAMFGRPLEEIAREPGEREVLLKRLIDAMLDLGSWKGDSPFLGGEEVNYADVMVAGMLQWLRRVGDKAEWEKVRDAIASQWAVFMETFAKWDVIDA
ncbi:hypothetical protein BV25DRAFT_1830058 [Artomyces pyxidatus]|uniref:Uncharacterized protein n=1 Tax=Artomyces pyxidatus TaxID=48021 RepID=A0ACB8SRL3_9AGAM|nr:hypothetical protein BV25DRAFT_1830058 [Artomyces pyxidatus]